VQAVAYEGAGAATLAPAVQEALQSADLIVVAPSNPILSIGPILAVPGLREALAQARAPRIAVSPLIGGTAVKGPSAQLMATLGPGADVAGVAAFYEGLIDQLVIDASDSHFARDIPVVCHATDILMRDAADKARLAAQVLDLAKARAVA
jgi:LPPG:FO 2-phospho-L-lactate transferase